MKRVSIGLILLFFSIPCLAVDSQKDPFDSVQWADMSAAFLRGKPVVFDTKVRVMAPNVAENPMMVPLTIDATDLKDVKEVIVFADFNPIPLIARYFPLQAKANLSLRFKIQQSSPVRAAVLTADGVWHIGGAWIDSAGGGCTVASTGRLSGDWADTLGDIRGKRWLLKTRNRIRLRISHPMDTGLVAGIPAFYIERLSFFNDQSEPLAMIELFEPVNENPVLSFDFNDDSLSSNIFMTGGDNNGNEFEAEFSQ